MFGCTWEAGCGALYICTLRPPPPPYHYPIWNLFSLRESHLLTGGPCFVFYANYATWPKLYVFGKDKRFEFKWKRAGMCFVFLWNEQMKKSIARVRIYCRTPRPSSTSLTSHTMCLHSLRFSIQHKICCLSKKHSFYIFIQARKMFDKCQRESFPREISKLQSVPFAIQSSTIWRLTENPSISWGYKAAVDHWLNTSSERKSTGKPLKFSQLWWNAFRTLNVLSLMRR